MSSRKSVGSVASRLNDAEAALLSVKTKLPASHDSRAQKLYDKTQSESAGLIKEGAKELFSAVKSQLGNFIQSSDVLITILDEVGELHPWIKVAVFPFKAALTLELKRKDNDKKVLALFIQMNDMMEVLRLLEPIKPQELGKEGGVLGERMKDKLEAAAKSIQDCSHVTHEYYKMKFIPKLLKSFKWEDKFSDLASTFVKFGSDLKGLIEIYTGTGVQAIHRGMGRIDAKIDLMMKLVFENFVSSEEQELWEFVKQKGGSQKFLSDEKLLSELVDKRAAQVKRSRRGGGDAPQANIGQERYKNISDLQVELKETLEITLQKSRGFFDEKFKEQENQIKELKVVIEREGDRIIEHIHAGAHENILDKVLYRIWVEMGWKGSAKARHVILAIHDFYIYQLQQSVPQEPPPSAIERHTQQRKNTMDNREMIQRMSQILPEVPELRPEDQWAIDYISGFRLRSLIEALDPDSSGFININEINDFTSARPAKWSLLNWLAYWAVGFEVTLRRYCYKIRAVLSEIDESYQSLLPGNTQEFSYFLHGTPMHFVDRLVAGVHTFSRDGSVADEYQHPSFEEYTRQNEQRTKKRLETFSYFIDERSTLSLLTGVGRLEEHIFPLVYLILKQIRRIVNEGSYRILTAQDFYNVNVSLNTIWICAWDRIQVLQRVFKFRNIPVDDELRRYAYGLYYYIYTDEGLDNDPGSYFNLPDSHFDPPVELDDEAHNEGKSRLHNQNSYEDSLDKIDVTPYEELATQSGIKLTGQWNGFYYYVERIDGRRTDGVMSFNINVLNEDGSFLGDGVDPLAKFSIKGRLGNLRLIFLKEYQQEFRGQRPTWLYQGIIDNSHENMDGLWSRPPDDFDIMSAVPADPHLDDPSEFHGTFVLSRKPVELIRFRPMELAFSENKTLALWKFARDAVLYKVSNGTLRWSILAARRDARHRFIELYRRYKNFIPYIDLPPNPEYEEFCDLQSTMIPADIQFYKNLTDATNERVVYHTVYCDSCGHDIELSTRYLCLECSKGHYTNSTVDICYRCISKSFTVLRENGSKQLKHIPTHPIVQIRRPLVHRQLYSCRGNAEMISKEKPSGSDGEEFPGGAKDGRVRCQSCGKDTRRPYWRCCKCDKHVLCMECNQRDEKRKPWLYERRPKPQKVYEDGPNTDYDTALLWGEAGITRVSTRDPDPGEVIEENGVPQEAASVQAMQNGELIEESQDFEEDNRSQDPTTEYTESEGFVENDQELEESVELSDEGDDDDEGEEEEEDRRKNIYHHWSHDLVLCTDPQALLPVITLDEKVEQVGKSVASLESRLVRMEELLQRLVTQLHPKM